MESSDASIVRRVLGGEVDAYAILVDRYFDHYVRCFTFGKTDITPVAYDPRERRYLIEHEYLSPALGARVVRDARARQCAACCSPSTRCAAAVTLANRAAAVVVGKRGTATVTPEELLPRS